MFFFFLYINVCFFLWDKLFVIMWLWCVDCPSACSSAGVTSLKWELCPFQISGTWRSVCALPLSCQVYLIHVVFIRFIIFTSISGVLILCVSVCTGHYTKISIRINWHTHMISVLLALCTYWTTIQAVSCTFSWQRYILKRNSLTHVLLFLSDF